MARLGGDSNLEIILSARDEASSTLASARKEFEKLKGSAQSIEGSLAAMQTAWLKYAAVAASAMYAAKKAWDYAETAARFEEQRTALDNLARQYDSSAHAILNAIQRAASGTISQMDAIGIANKGLMMGLNPQQLEFFTDAAERLSGAIGGDTAQAFETLTQAVATGQQRLLRQLGIIVDLEAEYKKYGHELSLAEKQTINFDVVSQALNMTFAKMGPGIDTAADKMERLTAKAKDLKISMGQLILEAAGAVYGALYPAQLEAAFAQAESDSKNLYLNLDALNQKAKELAATGLSIAPDESDSYRSRDWLTTNIEYMQHLNAEAEKFRENLLKTPLNIYWLPSDEEIERKAEAMRQIAREQEMAYQRYLAMGAGPGVRKAGTMPAEVYQMVEMYNNTEKIAAHHTQKIVELIAAGKATEAAVRYEADMAMLGREEQTNEMRMQSALAMSSMMTGTLQAMFVATGSKNKAMFEAYKTFAVASAMINAYLAASNVLANESKFGATTAYIMAGMIYL